MNAIDHFQKAQEILRSTAEEPAEEVNPLLVEEAKVHALLSCSLEIQILREAGEDGRLS